MSGGYRLPGLAYCARIASATRLWRAYIVAMRWSQSVKGICIGFLLIAYLVLAGPNWHSLWDPGLTLVLAVLLGIPSIFAHEFGHALAGRMLGFRLNYIRVGGDAFSIGPRIQFGLNLFRTGGLTTFQPSGLPMTRTGAVALHIAGPLVNLALVFIALFLIPIDSNVGWALLITNCALFIDSLIPTRSSRIPGGLNDGAKVWMAIVGKR